MKKYELTDEYIEIGFTTKIKLYRIKALVAIASIGVSAGDLGGYVEKESNLDQSGDAWVYDNAVVSGDAEVCGDAKVYGDAKVSERSDIVWFSNVGTEYGTLTVFKTKQGVLWATRGCFSGSVEEFLKKSAEIHDEKTKREYQLLIEVAKSRLNN
ncbi:hypothetical protein [Avibacterium paragallinarum]|uniref:Phage-like protein n=1 Tax=Avibacterium paragallinarum TaxID=728 RepID=A0A8B3TAJ6_AVIPA|nr:hypothetical protein [Avibacterium paragallinarum]RZN55764.1 hypothetical protein EIG79_11030 [Avibacterium paragallinarum]